MSYLVLLPSVQSTVKKRSEEDIKLGSLYDIMQRTHKTSNHQISDTHGLPWLNYTQHAIKRIIPKIIYSFLQTAFCPALPKQRL